MKVLIVAATQQEIAPLAEVLSLQSEIKTRQPDNKDFKLLTSDLGLLISGVGMVATAFALGQHLATNQYDLAINIGICGSFDRSIALGDMVEITTDQLAELGAEDDDSFLPMEQLGFGESAYNAGNTIAEVLQQSGTQNNDWQLKKVSGITVNTVHGNEMRINKVIDRLNPQVESMEGAAFFYACQQVNLPCLQIRAVSNYVEKRNRDNWQIGLAIKNMNIFAGKLLKQLALLP